MICRYCKHEINNQSVYCPICGQPVNQEMNVNRQVPKEFNPKAVWSEKHTSHPKHSGFRKGPVIVIISIMAAVIAVLVFMLTRKSVGLKPVNLEECIQPVTMSGISSEGKLDKDPEWDKEALKYAVEKSAGDKEIDAGYAVNDIVDNFTLTADKSSELSNGDSVTVQIGYHNKELIEEKYGIHFTGSSLTVPVRTLTNLREADPFEGLHPIFSGIAPVAKVSIDVSSIDASSMQQEVISWAREGGGSSYTITRNGENLKDQYVNIGDVLTITLNDTGQQRWRENGYIPSRSSVEYKVTSEDVSAYVQHFDEITDDTLSSIKKKKDDMMASEMAKSYKDADYELVGRIFLVPKDESWTQKTAPILQDIYHTIVPANEKNPELGYYFIISNNTITYVKEERQSDKIDDANSAEMENLASASGTQEVNYDSFSSIKKYSYIEELYQDCVEKRLDSYNIEYKDDLVDETLKAEMNRTEINLFDGLKPEFSGVSPFGKVIVNESVLRASGLGEDVMAWFKYNCSDYFSITRDGENVKNKYIQVGDSLEISLNKDGVEVWKRHGFVPSVVSSVFQVTDQDLPSYVLNYSDIPESAFQDLQKRIDDTVTSYVANNKRNSQSEFVGKIFLVPKPGTVWKDNQKPILWYIYRLIGQDETGARTTLGYITAADNGIVFDRMLPGNEGKTVSILEDSFIKPQLFNDFITFYNKNVDSYLHYYDIAYQDEVIQSLKE